MIQSEATNQKSVLVSKAVVRWLSLLLGAAFLCGILLLLVQAALHKQLNHDENMYVSSGLLLQNGQLPYRDYPYFQMPLLTLVYAAVVWVPGDALLEARVVNTLFAFGTCLVLVLGVWLLSAGASWPVRAALGVSGTMLYVSNPQLAYASGLAWNHDLPVFLTVCGVTVLACGFASQRPARLLFVSGLCFGLAVSARLSFSLLVPTMGLIVLAVVPQSEKRDVRARAGRLLAYSGGVLGGLLPALLFLAADPAGFWFGNVEYHSFNAQFWQQTGYTRAMTLGSKGSYLFDVLTGEPFNWMVAIGSALVLIIVWRGRPRSSGAMFVYLPAAATAALMVGALVPSPTWLQYFYAPSTLILFALMYGIAYLAGSRWGFVGQIVPGALAASVAVAMAIASVVAIEPRYQAVAGSLTVSTTPGQVKSTALEMRELLGVHGGTVATLGPIYPLEAGLKIYPELASGPFALRVAALVPRATGDQFGILSADGISKVLSRKPPDALLTGLEGGLEEPLVQFAVREGYVKSTLSNGLILWTKATDVH